MTTNDRERQRLVADLNWVARQHRDISAGVIAERAADLLEADAVERAALRKDAERYRHLRVRMQVRAEEAMNGSRRQAFQMRIGHAFVDSDHPLIVNEKECQRVDAAVDIGIDAALAPRADDKENAK